MKRISVLAACLLGLFVHAENPASRITSLLEDLRSKIEKDGESDEAVHKEQECWCEEVKSSKSALIDAAEKKVKELQADIQVLEAKNVQTMSELDRVTADLQDSTATKEAASANREEASADFKSKTGGYKDTLSGIQDVKTKYGDTSEELTDVLNTVHGHVSSDLKTASTKEERDQENFKELIAEKDAQIALLKGRKLKKKTEHATTETAIAEATELEHDTEAQRAADVAFLEEATLSCEARAMEFVNRTKLRNDELGGIDKALSIIQDNWDVLSKHALLQIQTKSIDKSGAPVQALALLEKGGPRLIALSKKLRLALPQGGFAAVLESIDAMLASLKKDAADDKEKKEKCQKDNFAVEKAINKHEFLVKQSQAKLNALQVRLEQREAEKAEALGEIANVKQELGNMTAVREEEHQLFKTQQADDKMAVETLENVSGELAKYYEEHGTGAAPASAFAQYDPEALSDKTKELKKKAREHKLSDKEGQKGAASVVLALIDHIAENVKAELQEGVAAEEAAQLHHEKELVAMEAVKERLEKKIASLEGMIADRDSEKADEELALSDAEAEVKSQEKYQDAIKPDCDWLLSNFDERASGREAEMDSLQNAKILLSGASP